MNRMKVWMMLVAVIACCATTGCKNKTADTAPVNDTVQEAEQEPLQTAIDRYLADVIGTQYALGEMCIPSSAIIDVDSTNMEDIKVWGDFWVFNYNQSGDTLKTVSGGSHPGLIHLNRVPNGFEVTSFDAVGDGSHFEETAKQIFGDKYPAFHAINSDQDKREAIRKNAIAAYVKRNNLTVNKYQDFGWPAKELFEADSVH